MNSILINEEIFLPLIIKLFSITSAGFILAMLITPIFTHFAYKYQWWKKVKDVDMSGKKTPVFHKLHAAKHKRNIPTMAGIIIWLTVAILTLVFNFDRAQTYLPLFTLVSIGLLGLVDDYVNMKSTGGIAGLKAKIKMSWLIIFSAIGAYWFYFKLGFNYIHIPAFGDMNVGIFYIPIFIFIVIASANAVNITDGLDGLSGGLLASAFGAYSIIAFFQGNFGISLFCGTIVGAVLAYTWFNIYPARFFMGDTGAVSLGATLGVIALLTNTVLVLPFIAFIFVVETLSVILQLLSKKYLKRKIFLSAPIHHHFEASGWPETKVTMRFWIVGTVMALIGITIALIGRGSL